MKDTHRIAVVAAAFALTIARLSSQTPSPKPSFDVISIKPSAPPGNGPIRIGGGARGDRFTMSSATLRMLLQTAYQRANNTPAAGQLEIIGGPGWMESDRYDVQAKADCSGGSIPRAQLQLMVQSLLEDRFKLKAHMETRELPIYNLVASKDGPKIKRSADQTPPALAAGLPGPCEPAPAGDVPPFPGGRGNPFAPGSPPPRGSIMMMMGAGAGGMTMRGTAMPFANLVGLLRNQLGRQVVDKTGLEGLFDFELTFTPEGLSSPFGRGLPVPPPAPPPAGAATGPASAASTAADPAPSLFAALQELGLKLESAKGPVEVLVVESVEKPTEN
jgi:uncharacterized protein (TIGR03435 family)